MLTPILATTAYILSPDRSRVLLIHRNKRPDDNHWGKYLGPGGRLEPDEDIMSGIRREIREETGVIADDVTLRGTILWTGFGHNSEDWFGFVFRVDSFHGEPHDGNEEGTLAWVPVDALHTVPMWDSDHEWLPMVFDDDPRQFHGVMPYRAGQMVSWSFQRV